MEANNDECGIHYVESLCRRSESWMGEEKKKAMTKEEIRKNLKEATI